MPRPETAAMQPTPAVIPTADERRWAAGVHLLGLVLAFVTSWAAGIAGAAGALAVWLLKRDESAFIAAHAKEALNFNLSMFVYAVVLVALTLFTLGLGLIVTVPIAIVVALAWLIATIVAAVRAYDGLPYRYPITIRFVR
ncbi:DUF4870 domain-containing protein [Tolypothrix campylonemoides VB511288]|nr:DUF4870 domain-containing protein [Tolypothrix campylonemoides VB511288]